MKTFANPLDQFFALYSAKPKPKPAPQKTLETTSGCKVLSLTRYRNVVTRKSYYRGTVRCPFTHATHNIVWSDSGALIHGWAGAGCIDFNQTEDTHNEQC